MARRNRRSRRRRTAGFLPVYKILSFVAICAAIGVALSLFFKTEQIEVSGNARYTADQVAQASGITVGDNMFLLNKYSAGESICTTLPYIESVQIRRRLPTTMEIHVNECVCPIALQQDGTCYLLGPGGKIVDEVSAAKAKDLPHITGVKLSAPMVGQLLALEENDLGNTDELLLTLLKSLHSKDMLTHTQRLDLSDSKNVVLRYMDRFDVTFPKDADVNYKLDYLRAVVERLEVNETGAIDMTEEGKASFTPA